MERDTLTFADFQIAEILENEEHDLKKMEEMVDWRPINKILATADFRCSSYYGRDNYSPEVMFRILLIKRFNSFSDRQVATQVKFNFLYRWFCKLSLDASVPDYSTICRWRERFETLDIYEQVFEEFNRQIANHGYHVKNGMSIDSTLIKSAARPRKTTTITEYRPLEDPDTTITTITIETSKDPDATWTKKNKTWYYGVKGHIATDDNGLIKAVITTTASTHDGQILPELIEKAKPDEGCEVKADKAYDSAENRECLEEHGLKDGIMRKKQKGKADTTENIERNKEISGTRFVVERTFGTLKRMLDCSRSNYIGIKKTNNWLIMGAFVYNLIRCKNLRWDNCLQTS